MGAGFADSGLGELEHKCSFVEVLLWLFYLNCWKSSFSFQIEDQLVSLGLLIAVFYNGREHACVRGHYGRIEDELDILMLMGRNFDLLGIDVKGKLFNSIWSLLLCLKFDRTSYLIIIFYLYLLHDSFRVLGGYESAEVEQPLIYVENVRLDHIFNATRLLLVLKYELLLEDRLEVLCIYSWDAGLCHKLIEDSIGFICWIAVLDIDCDLLLEKFLAFSCEGDLNDCAAVGSDCSRSWVNGPLSDLQARLLFSSFSCLFRLFLDLLDLLLCAFLRVNSSRSSDVVSSLKLSLSFLLHIRKQLLSEVFITEVKKTVVELKQSLIFDLEGSCL